MAMAPKGTSRTCDPIQVRCSSRPAPEMVTARTDGPLSGGETLNRPAPSVLAETPSTVTVAGRGWPPFVAVTLPVKV